MTGKIKRVFIANRGEIARRIAHSAKALGIETATILEAGENLPTYLWGLIDHFTASQKKLTKLYQDPDSLVKSALELGCDALHPGFGFLSENPIFARKVVDAGVIWIGPSALAIEKLGNKENARRLAFECDIPCIPGIAELAIDQDNPDLTELRDFADQVGYPVVVKAPMGGGGRGMCLINGPEELNLEVNPKLVALLKEPSLMVEKYLSNPAHIEVQILADQKDRVLAIGDRNCSIQRRHQKIIEEAPALNIKTSTKKRLAELAIKIMAAGDYSSCGTVEFLVCSKDNREQLYFLEVNTRLQVEHTVTEQVYGIDLVAWQFRIAGGEALGADMAELSPRGHAIEARIYGEDIDNSFFPAPGDLFAFAPYSYQDIRWEVGIDTPDEVSCDFDPMVAKVIATGETRENAIKKLQIAIENTVFSGPKNNLELLKAIVAEESFMVGQTTTPYLSERFEKLVAAIATERDQYSAIANTIFRFFAHNGHQFSHILTTSSTTSFGNLTTNIFSQDLAATKKCDIIITQEDLKSTQNQKGIITIVGQGNIKLQGGNWLPFTWISAKSTSGLHLSVAIKGHTFVHQNENRPAAPMGTTLTPDNDRATTSPIPGKVIKLLTKNGEYVKKEQILMIIESMKMEFEIKAPGEARVGEVKIAQGERVSAEDTLIIWERLSPE